MLQGNHVASMRHCLNGTEQLGTQGYCQIERQHEDNGEPENLSSPTHGVAMPGARACERQPISPQSENHQEIGEIQMRGKSQTHPADNECEHVGKDLVFRL